MFHDRIPAALEKLPVSRARHDVWAALLPRRSRTAFRIGLSAATAIADILVIVSVAAGIDVAYRTAFDGTGPVAGHSGSFELAALVALFVLLTNLVREDYHIETLLARRPHLRRATTVWIGAWAVVLLIGFATKTTHEYSRLVSLGMFAGGLPAMLFARATMLRLVRSAATSTSGNTNRVHLVGYGTGASTIGANRAGPAGNPHEQVAAALAERFGDRLDIVEPYATGLPPAVRLRALFLR